MDLAPLIAELAAAKKAFDLANSARYDAVMAQEAAEQRVAAANDALTAAINAQVESLNA